MGHATHFLTRLSRAAPASADLALALYRDPELVKAILASVDLPEGAERVAVALENGPEPSRVVLTRTGAFVTCLGPGMRVDLPVITRAKVDSVAVQRERIRSWLAAADEATQRHGHMGVVARLLAYGGPTLSREDFRALLAVCVVGARTYLERLVGVAGRTAELRRAGPTSPQRRRPSAGGATSCRRLTRPISCGGHRPSGADAGGASRGAVRRGARRPRDSPPAGMKECPQSFLRERTKWCENSS